jgi:hypothetical protein
MNDILIFAPKAPRGLNSMPTEIHVQIFRQLLRKTESDYLKGFKLDPFLYRSNDIAKRAQIAVEPYISAFPPAANVWKVNHERILRCVANDSADILIALLNATRTKFLRSHFRYCVWRAVRLERAPDYSFERMLAAWNERTAHERMMMQIRHDLKGVFSIVGQEGANQDQGGGRMYLLS